MSGSKVGGKKFADVLADPTQNNRIGRLLFGKTFSALS